MSPPCPGKPLLLLCCQGSLSPPKSPCTMGACCPLRLLCCLGSLSPRVPVHHRGSLSPPACQAPAPGCLPALGLALEGTRLWTEWKCPQPLVCLGDCRPPHPVRDSGLGWDPPLLVTALGYSRGSEDVGGRRDPL